MLAVKELPNRPICRPRQGGVPGRGSWHRTCFVAVVVSATLCPGIAMAQTDELELHQFDATQRHMGTDFSVRLYAASEADAKTAFEAAFARIAELDRCLSNYKPESDVNRFCRTAPHEMPQPLHADLYAVLQASQRLSATTSGAFDVTVGPLSRLWRRARRFKQPVKETALTTARAATGYELLELHDREPQGRLTRPKMKIDLGGIAKGYALDAALDEIKRHGIAAALVNGGGDIAAGTPPPGRNGWRVGLTSLDDGNADAGFILIANQAIATSGDLWQFIEIDGQRFSHLIDPRTGRPVLGRHNATVIADRAMAADAWASALLVLGPEAGLELMHERAPKLTARVLTFRDERANVKMSPEFPPVERTDQPSRGSGQE